MFTWLQDNYFENNLAKTKLKNTGNEYDTMLHLEQPQLKVWPMSKLTKLPTPNHNMNANSHELTHQTQSTLLSLQYGFLQQSSIINGNHMA